MQASTQELIEASDRRHVRSMRRGVAFQVGRTGCAVGIDTKAAAVQLARGSVQSLIRADADFARQAAPMRFHTQNVFIPSLRHKVSCLLLAATVDASQKEDMLFLLTPGTKPVSRCGHSE